MKKLGEALSVILFSTLMVAGPAWSGTTGKIAGTITDKSTGAPLPGANVQVVGTSLGAAADLDGHYTILQVPPGTYELKVSMVGYKQTLIEKVYVNIDQTARVDLAMETEAVKAAEVVVTARRNLVEPDVATSVTSITSQEAQRLPAINAVSALGLQAGVQGGFSGPLGYGGGITIRGSSGDQIKFNVNGVTLRDPRNNLPDESIPLSSLKDLSLVRGGFSAEYGQVMGGLVNAVTRQGGKRSYSGRIEVRMAPPHAKYWLAPGTYDLTNPMSYALRPFFDPAVCWTGTQNGNWDFYTQKEYPQFQGWDAVSQQLNANGINLTPAAAQRAFEYEIRKAQINNQPDYQIDAGFGGPVPVVSSALGDLRFYAAYRTDRTMLLWPLSRPDYRDYTGTFQLNSDLSPTMRLEFYGLMGQTLTEASNWNTPESYFQSPTDVVSNAGSVLQPVDLFTLFSNFNFSLANIRNRSLSAKLTQTLSDNTYYDVTLQNYTVHYDTGPGGARDTSAVTQIVPGFFEDSNPFGFWPYKSTSVTDVLVGSSSFYSRTRDNSSVSTTSLKANITSQVNFENQIKAGLEFDYTSLHFDYGITNPAAGATVYSTRTLMSVYPYRGGAYLQDKLETKEFTMNAGLRLDYSDANVNWWDVNPFDAAFYQPADSSALAGTQFPTKPARMRLDLEPRLAIAHPISQNAKLYFNYGWFRELPTYETMFAMTRQSNQAVQNIGNPNLVLAKNVAYELGVDFSLADDWLLQTSAYYKDYTDQQGGEYPNYTDYTNTTYISTQGFQYVETSSNNYSDQKGFEITLTKTAGKWVKGFIDYTYQVNSGGHFGDANIYNSISQQQIYNATTDNQYQNRNIPAPFARANVDFSSPSSFGPTAVGNHILGDIMLNIVLDWQAGYWQTYNPNNQLNTGNNVQAVDYFNAYLRIMKTIDFGKLNFRFFMDVDNLTNNLSNDFRSLAGNDQNYLASLHLPPSNAYPNIPGNDKIGDYRKPGVAWQPIQQQTVDVNSAPPATNVMKGSNSIAMYYNSTTGKYWWYGPHGYSNGSAGWWPVPQSKVDQVMKDKSYIQMPEESTFWFLNPRTFYFGITMTFNF